MAKARKTARAKKDEATRPSIFFIVAMIVGFAILVWWFMHFLPSRAGEGEDEKQTSVSVEFRSA